MSKILMVVASVLLACPIEAALAQPSDGKKGDTTEKFPEPEKKGAGN